MKKNIFTLFVIVLALSMIFTITACVTDDPEIPGNEEPGETVKPDGDSEGGETDDPSVDVVEYKVSFDTQGGSTMADITVAEGSVIGDIASPTKQCAEFVCFATNADGSGRWNLQSDQVRGDVCLYAIWKDAHTWGEWKEVTAPDCIENGESKKNCDVCGAVETRVEAALGHDFDNGKWSYNDNVHWKKCVRCGVNEEFGHQHSFDENNLCECGYKYLTVDDLFDFKSLGNGEWEITSYKGSQANVTVPADYNGGKVVSIGIRAFDDNKTVKSIIVPEGVRIIGYEAFSGCTNLQTVSLPNSLVMVDDKAFYGVTRTFKFKYNEYAGGRYVGNESNPYLVLVDFVDNTGSLTEFTLHEDTRIIPYGAFTSYDCKNIKKITLSDNLVYIGGHVFGWYKDSYNASYNTYNGSKYLGSVNNPYMVLISGENIHKDTQFITSNAFTGDVQSVVIPDNVKGISDWAFAQCDSLISISLPKSLSYMAQRVFMGCTSLTSISYRGTVQDWNKIILDDLWSDMSQIKSIRCTDGNVLI